MFNITINVITLILDMFVVITYMNATLKTRKKVLSPLFLFYVMYSWKL